MLIKKQILQGIVEGNIRYAFRRWKRCTVKAGGELRTAVGVLAIDAVELVKPNQITAKQAIQAGYASKAELISDLNGRAEGETYRIALRYLGDDPRKALRQNNNLSDDELSELKNRLESMDKRAKSGPWTRTTLGLIAENPATRAPDLAESISMETKKFKTNVRKLKELGLTESLKVGYRLSPRGEAVYQAIIQ